MNAIDLPALRGLLKQTEAEIIGLKAQLRRTWTRPMAAEQKTLCALKRRATSLCVLRALMRGKLHLQGVDREAHAAIAKETADRYKLERRAAC